MSRAVARSVRVAESGVARARRASGLALLAVLLLAAAVALTGCGSTAASVKAETYCYKAVDSTARVVDVGMSAAGDAYRAGLVSEKAKDGLIAAHDVYRPIGKAALSGCKVVGSKGDADRVIASLQEAADAVIRALVAMGATP